jgi:hypothetical protein
MRYFTDARHWIRLTEEGTTEMFRKDLDKWVAVQGTHHAFLASGYCEISLDRIKLVLL